MVQLAGTAFRGEVSVDDVGLRSLVRDDLHMVDTKRN